MLILFIIVILSNNELNSYEIFQNVEPRDLIKYGLIPEFIGRLPVVTSVDELDQDALIEILTEPKNAITKQFEILFKMDNVELEIKTEALLEIAKLAVKRKTGARGIRSIMEDLFMDLMFEAPNMKDLKKIVINSDTVRKKAQPILLFSNKENNQKFAVKS